MSSTQPTSIEKSNNNKELESLDGLSQYLKAQAGSREGIAIPPLESWHPEQVVDMDMVIKANGEWWHEGGKVTRQSLVSLFASVLWLEVSDDGEKHYYLKMPAQKFRIKVEDVPFVINDVGIVQQQGVNWLEFTTTTGDVVRLDDQHQLQLRQLASDPSQTRPYMLVRNGLEALISRNVFYHLIELGKLTENNGETILSLNSGGNTYQVAVPN